MTSKSKTKAQTAKTTPAGAVELEEAKLDKVAGGRKAGEGQQDFLKITI